MIMNTVHFKISGPIIEISRVCNLLGDILFELRADNATDQQLLDAQDQPKEAAEIHQNLVVSNRAGKLVLDHFIEAHIDNNYIIPNVEWL